MTTLPLADTSQAKLCTPPGPSPSGWKVAGVCARAASRAMKETARQASVAASSRVRKTTPSCSSLTGTSIRARSLDVNALPAQKISQDAFSEEKIMLDLVIRGGQVI